MDPFCVLVVAKVPVPGRVKTRLCPAVSACAAADIAAAALLDTLATARRLAHGRPVVALQGDLDQAVRRDEILEEMRGIPVIDQRGDTFAERLAHAHADTADLFPGSSVLQIGMDTPQVTPAHLESAATVLGDGHDAVLGPAVDGGWWLLGLRKPLHAERVLPEVPLSRADTGRRTLAALTYAGLNVGELDVLSDVDTLRDALDVARLVPGSRFARAVHAVRR